MATAPLIIDGTREEKVKFARLMLATNDPNKAALALTSDVSRALRIAHSWPFDSDVITITAEIVEEEGSSAFLPPRHQILAEIKKRADDTKAPTDYKVLMELYAKIAGFIEKPGGNIHIGDNKTTNVLMIPVQATDEDWERSAARSQGKLIESAAS